GVGGFTRAAVPAVDPHITGEDRQHCDGARGLLTVGLALWTPALANVGRFSGADFASQLNDSVCRNAGNAGGPLRRFGRVVITLTEDPGFVVSVCWRTFRQRFFIVADAVFIEERLVDKVFGDQDPRKRAYQRGVRPRTDRYPLVLTACGSVGIAWIDNNHPRIRTFTRLF